MEADVIQAQNIYKNKIYKYLVEIRPNMFDSSPSHILGRQAYELIFGQATSIEFAG